MFNHSSIITGDAVRSLLGDNRKALQACNQISRMNFEHPFGAFVTVGKFTANSIKKQVSDWFELPEPWEAVVFFRFERWSGHLEKELHVATLRSDADKFDIKFEKFYPSNFALDTFYGVGQFNEARKTARGNVYVIAQADEYRNEKPAPRTVSYVEALKNGERFRNPEPKYSSIYVTRIDGKGERIEAFPRSRYGYNSYTSTGVHGMLDTLVDKSGYSALPALIDRKQRALRRRLKGSQKS